MDTWTTIEVNKNELASEWSDLLRPVARASKGLRRIRLYDADVRIHESDGHIFLVFSGTSDFQRETEVYLDLDDLAPKGKHLKAREIFESLVQFLGDNQD
jgi:hypothetical protein